MFGLRMPELILIFLIVVLLFGANRIPKLGKALGETFRGFRDAAKEVQDATKDIVEETPKAKPPAELPGRPAASAEAGAAEREPAEKKRA